MLYYTLLVGKNAPNATIQICKGLVRRLTRDGLVYRSTCETRTDKVLDQMVEVIGGQREIFLPWENYRERTANIDKGYWVLEDPHYRKHAVDHCRAVWPSWDHLNGSNQRNLLRVVYSLAGPRLKSPSFIFVYWGLLEHQTTLMRLAVLLANRLTVPTFNLAAREDQLKLVEYLQALRGVVKENVPSVSNRTASELPL